jgi:hypothetical protein
VADGNTGAFHLHSLSVCISPLVIRQDCPDQLGHILGQLITVRLKHRVHASHSLAYATSRSSACMSSPPSPPSSVPRLRTVNPYADSNTALEILCVTRPTGPRYSLIWSMGSTPSQTNAAFVVANCGKTNPGQSHSNNSGERWMVWKCFVFPGVEDTETFLAPRRELMVDDLPTLG